MPFIVTYHRVVENFERSAKHAIPSMLISSRMLERHIDWLAKRYRVVSLDEIGLHLESERRFRHQTAAITFDDGYSDVYRNAFPLLRRKGIPAAVFVVTELAGGPRFQIHDKLYLLLRCAIQRGYVPRADPLTMARSLMASRPQDELVRIVADLENRIEVEETTTEEMLPLTWDMIADMHRNGITIGSHTRTHVLLTQERPERVRDELTVAKRTLEERLKIPVKHFAYPDGRFNDEIVKGVAAAGYKFGYGICRVRNTRYPLLTIPRKVLWERASLNVFGRFSSAVMYCQVHGLFDGKDGCEHEHGTSELRRTG